MSNLDEISPNYYSVFNYTPNDINQEMTDNTIIENTIIENKIPIEALSTQPPQELTEMIKYYDLTGNKIDNPEYRYVHTLKEIKPQITNDNKTLIFTDLSLL